MSFPSTSLFPIPSTHLPFTTLSSTALSPPSYLSQYPFSPPTCHSPSPSLLAVRHLLSPFSTATNVLFHCLYLPANPSHPPLSFAFITPFFPQPATVIHLLRLPSTVRSPQSLFPTSSPCTSSSIMPMSSPVPCLVLFIRANLRPGQENFSSLRARSEKLIECSSFSSLCQWLCVQWWQRWLCLPAVWWLCMTVAVVVSVVVTICAVKAERERE